MAQIWLINIQSQQEEQTVFYRGIDLTTSTSSIPSPAAFLFLFMFSFREGGIPVACLIMSEVLAISNKKLIRDVKNGETELGWNNNVPNRHT